MHYDSNIRRFFYRYLIIILKVNIIIVVGFSSSSEATSDIEIKNYIAKELKNIPEYCQVRLAEVYFQKEYPVQIRTNIPWPPHFMKSLNKWKNAIGSQNWMYFHHYCFGVRDINDYMSIDYDQRNSHKHQYMKRALGQFQFMENANTMNFPFWYELYRYELYIYFELGDVGNAQRVLKQSLKYRRKKLDDNGS